MIDLTLLREKSAETIALLQKKDPSFDAQKLYELDSAVRKIRLEVEALRHTKNELAQKAKSGITPELREQSIAIGKQLKHQEESLVTIEQEFMHLYLACPNLIEADLPEGGKEANKVVKTWGEKKQLGFTPKNHLELGTKLGWLDFEAAAVMTGGQFAFYKQDAVKLLYNLTMLMLKNNNKYGYQMMLPPYLVNEKSLEVASNFPKFKDQVYAVQEDGLYLIPTSEVSLTNLYRNQIIPGDELPLRMTSWTSCFRREAGGYGASERGLIRIHQFEKVELYTLCKPADAHSEQERMLACAENILQTLGLHYRVSLLAAQDCSFPSARTYDIEVWLPGQNQYYEVSSVSNCTDFQARRGMIRFRQAPDSKPELVYTLNGSSLALPRLMVALLEVYQQEDGSVALPECITKQSVFEI
ncbi:MAG: serine--tRNA ligase [Candidatus Dependentiae bacterium]|nr:serine--tRNA ligase [Candidatus Dependentiae bacterium]